MTNTINLNDIFKDLESHLYCIIKLDTSFPNYIFGQDIDIFSYNLPSFSSSLIDILKSFLKDDITIKSTSLNDGKQIHLDLLNNEKIEFRFDLYGAMPRYKNIDIKNGFFAHVIENKIAKKISTDTESYNIYIPSSQNELILRYLEYIEYFQHIPDKVKHADYILNQLEKTPSDISYIDVLHHYIDVPPIDITSNRFNSSKPSLFKRLFK